MLAGRIKRFKQNRGLADTYIASVEKREESGAHVVFCFEQLHE